MSDSNKLLLTVSPEANWGVLNPAPTPQKSRVTSESLGFTQTTAVSEEIRDDRMISDLVITDASAAGALPFELSYGSYDDFLESLQMSRFVENATVLPADVLGIALDIFNVTDGEEADFVVGDLIVTSGFADPANNGIFQISAIALGEITCAGQGLVDEVGTGLIKRFGFFFGTSDIAASATGLTSTVADFTTLGLVVGQWIKIGGGSVGTKFATAANNDFVRVTAIAANVLTLDHLPIGWAVDAGVGVELMIAISEYLRTGDTQYSFTFEKSFQSQAVPSYIRFYGMLVNAMNIDMAVGAILTGSFDFIGKNSTIDDASVWGATPVVAATSTSPMNSVDDVGGINENGARVLGPNFIQGLSLAKTNNLREQKAVGFLGSVGVGTGDSNITGTLSTYFGDKSLYEKFLNNVETKIAAQIDKNNQSYVFTLPRVKISSGVVQAGARNQDVLAEMEFQGLYDSVTDTDFQIDRFPFLNF